MRLIPSILAKIDMDSPRIFRGHSNRNWELQPSIGRYFSGDWDTIVEEERFSLLEFQRRSKPHLNIHPTEKIEWLCLMQHHGCPTRLLDFTTNPLVALFFASDPTIKTDGELITTQYKSRESVILNDDPFSHKTTFVHYPHHTTSRIVNQSGCFVFSAEPNKPLRGTNQKGLVIEATDKVEVREELNLMGITHSTIFPGIDGICNDLKERLVDKLYIAETHAQMDMAFKEEMRKIDPTDLPPVSFG